MASPNEAPAPNNKKSLRIRLRMPSTSTQTPSITVNSVSHESKEVQPDVPLSGNEEKLNKEQNASAALQCVDESGKQSHQKESESSELEDSRLTCSVSTDQSIDTSAAEAKTPVSENGGDSAVPAAIKMADSSSKRPIDEPNLPSVSSSSSDGNEKSPQDSPTKGGDASTTTTTTNVVRKRRTNPRMLPTRINKQPANTTPPKMMAPPKPKESAPPKPKLKHSPSLTIQAGEHGEDVLGLLARDENLETPDMYSENDEFDPSIDAVGMMAKLPEDSKAFRHESWKKLNQIDNATAEKRVAASKKAKKALQKAISESHSNWNPSPEIKKRKVKLNPTVSANGYPLPKLTTSESSKKSLPERVRNFEREKMILSRPETTTTTMEPMKAQPLTEPMKARPPMEPTNTILPLAPATLKAPPGFVPASLALFALRAQQAQVTPYPLQVTPIQFSPEMPLGYPYTNLRTNQEVRTAQEDATLSVPPPSQVPVRHPMSAIGILVPPLERAFPANSPKQPASSPRLSPTTSLSPQRGPAIQLAGSASPAQVTSQPQIKRPPVSATAGEASRRHSPHVQVNPTQVPATPTPAQMNRPAVPTTPGHAIPNSGVPRPSPQGQAVRPAQPRPSALYTRNTLQHMPTTPPNAPTKEDIQIAIPEDASCIVHVYDRRVNLDACAPDASNYSLLRAWVQDDPYRQMPPSGSNILERMSRPCDKRENQVVPEFVHSKKKRRIDESEPCNVLSSMSTPSTPDLPSVDSLRQELVSKSKRLKRKKREEDREWMKASRENLKSIGIHLPVK